jgi:hypothetical protein
MAENENNIGIDKNDLNYTYYDRHAETVKNRERTKFHGKDHNKILARRRELYNMRKGNLYTDINQGMKANYYQENKDHINEMSRMRHAGVYRDSEQYKIIANIKSLINTSLKYGIKSKKVEYLTGVQLHVLRYYLESKFEPGMSWDNRKEWHIDHIVPVSSFDITQLADIKKCYHYTNLRPMWANENLHKAATPPSPPNPESTKPSDPEPTQIPADSNRT